VSLTVADDGGLTDVQRTQVQVLNEPLPAAEAKGTTQPCTVPAKSASGGTNISPTSEAAMQPLHAVIELRLSMDTSDGVISFPTASVVPSKPESSKQAKKSRTSKKEYTNGGLSQAIRFTELLPKPNEGADAEWIEIINAGNKTVNLGNWMLADTAKQKSPYIIPDAVTLAPGQFYIFKRSDTKISLNDSEDSLFLYDYNDRLIDQITYAKAKKGHSYALITTSQQADGERFASANGAPPDRTKISWEWIETPTPGAPNPSYELLHATVDALTGGAEEHALDVTLAGGEDAILFFDDSVIDPEIAELGIGPGTFLEAIAQQNIDSTYELERIQSVTPPAPPEVKTKSNKMIWIVSGLLLLTLIINLVPVAKKLLQKRRENS